MSVPRLAATLSAAFGICIFSPVTSFAQAPVYLRLSPELALLSVEHTKLLTDASGPSSSTENAAGHDFVANLSIGYFAKREDNWLGGGELQFSISTRQAIAGSMPAVGSGPGSVGPGTWDFRNRVAAGANLFIGRALARGRVRSYFLVGVKRWTTETTSRAIDPELGEYSDRDIGVRWPLNVGIGITLLRERSVDVRLRYSFSTTMEWDITRLVDPESDEPMPETLTWDYTFTGSGLSLQVGIGTG